MFGEIECSNVSDELSKVERKLTEQTETEISDCEKRFEKELSDCENRLIDLMNRRLVTLKGEMLHIIADIFFFVYVMIGVIGVGVELIFSPSAMVGNMFGVALVVVGALCLIFYILSFKTAVEIVEINNEEYKDYLREKFYS